MYYKQTYQTKWHDADPCGVLRPSALLVYMQETGNLQCRDCHCDLNHMFYEDGMGFLLSRIMIRVDEPLHAYENIEVRTWCPPSRGLTFLRCFSVHREGRIVAEAISHWALMDVRAHQLIRVSDFNPDFPMDDMLDEATLPRRVHIPPATPMETVGERKIVYSDLDFNHHMNNTRYPDMICDFLPDMAGKWVSSLSLSYMREAANGDTLTVHRAAVTDTPDTYLIRTTRPDGAVCLEAEVALSDIPPHRCTTE